MIKLDLPPKPTELTEELQKRLTQEFKDTKKSVWDIEWLKKAVLAKSYNKCCYSEIRLNEESKYMEIEHFHPKDIYSDEVMSWENLLPSCKKCNTTKGAHDTIREPIINPFVDNPKDYFYFENSFYRARKNDEKAKLSIKKLALNDIVHFVEPRDRISNRITMTLKDLHQDVISCEDCSKLGIYAERLKRLLSEGNRKKEYSALVSTTILSNTNFQNIENQLKKNNLWDKEFEELKQELKYCALLK